MTANSQRGRGFTTVTMRFTMSIYDVLKKDHEVVLDLLQRMENTSEATTQDRLRLLGQLREVLIPHMRAEEKVLYDTLIGLNETEDFALEAYEEHHTIELVLRELEALEPSDQRWRAKLRVLKGNIEAHVQDEIELLTYAREIFAPAEAEMMGEAFRSVKADVAEGSMVRAAAAKVIDLMPLRFSHRWMDLQRAP